MLAIEKLILIVIFLVVLVVSLILLFGIGRGTADPIVLQNELRQCCGAFRASGCIDTTLDCSGNTIDSIRIKLNIDDEQLKKFCNCPT